MRANDSEAAETAASTAQTERTRTTTGCPEGVSDCPGPDAHPLERADMCDDCAASVSLGETLAWCPTDATDSEVAAAAPGPRPNDADDATPFPAPTWDDDAGSRIGECSECGYRAPKRVLADHDHTPCRHGHRECDGPGSLRTCAECRRE